MRETVDTVTAPTSTQVVAPALSGVVETKRPLEGRTAASASLFSFFLITWAANDVSMARTGLIS